MKKTNKELGEILANETLSVTQMDMELNNLKQIDKQKWVYHHCGFIAGLKVMGRSDKDVEEILTIAQKELENIQNEKSRNK